MPTEILFAISAVAVLLVAAFAFERSKISAQHIVLIGVFASLASFSRIPFAVIPSVQPSTFLIILAGVGLGSRAGCIVGIVTVLVSNSFLGHGPWSLFQMIAWSACGFSAGVFAPFLGRKLVLASFGALWGILFGLITNIWIWYTLTFPRSFSSWIAVQVPSIPFDLMHAATNFLLLYLFGLEFLKILERFTLRFRETAA